MKARGGGGEGAMPSGGRLLVREFVGVHGFLNKKLKPLILSYLSKKTDVIYHRGGREKKMGFIPHKGRRQSFIGPDQGSGSVYAQQRS